MATAKFTQQEIVRSTSHKSRTFTHVSEIKPEMDGQTVLLRVRLQNSRLQKGGCFLTLRETPHTIQGLVWPEGEEITADNAKWVSQIPSESLVDVEGVVSDTRQRPVKSCTVTDAEIKVTNLTIVSKVEFERLPLQYADASAKVSEEDIAAAEEAERKAEADAAKAAAPAAAPAAEGEGAAEGGEVDPKQAAKDAKKAQKEKEKAEKAAKKAAAAAARGGGDKKRSVVTMETRLNNRIMDLRTRANHGIFRIQSGVEHFFREYLVENGFVGIHSPKLLGTASEGGANVFKVKYFEREACLAQSPQLYKQMALQGDLHRVFEIGSVFRAEDSNTHRHLTEFVGLDLEMTIYEHYYEVLDVAEELFVHIFNRLNEKYRDAIELVREQHPFEDLVYQIPAEKLDELDMHIIEENKEGKDPGRVRNRDVRVLRLQYPDGVKMINEGLVEVRKNPPSEVRDEKWEDMKDTEDLKTTYEKLLGKLVKAKYGVDFFILDKYPSAVRPFYTMPSQEDEKFSNSYDLFIRGEEISSGAQRIHDAQMLLDRAKSMGVPPEQLKDYADSFRLGAYPHGGFGVGLERVVMLFLGLHNIRKVSMFPRDPKRVTP